MDHLLSSFYIGSPANRELDAPLTSEQKASMIAAAAEKVSELLDVLHIDHRSDANTRDTPRRVARMYVEELLAGRFSAPPAIMSAISVPMLPLPCMRTTMRSTTAGHLSL